jgi:hypothetical protein
MKMKKFVFALEMMSLMLVLPVYIVVELNHPTVDSEKAVYVQKSGPSQKGMRGDMGISLPGSNKEFSRVK